MENFKSHTFQLVSSNLECGNHRRYLLNQVEAKCIKYCRFKPVDIVDDSDVF